MSSGVSVIAADAGGFRESIHHGATGLLVPPANPHGYAEAIIELTLDPAARFLLGAAAREQALGRDVEPENADLLARYAGLIGVAERSTAPCAA
jgi:glycosyltransferase involved in cell wall biosynthesis